MAHPRLDLGIGDTRIIKKRGSPSGDPRFLIGLDAVTGARQVRDRKVHVSVVGQTRPLSGMEAAP